MRIVLVEWDDTVTHSAGWTPKDSEGGDNIATPCVSVGLLEDGNCEITLWQSINPRMKAQAITIPRGCIKKITELRVR